MPPTLADKNAALLVADGFDEHQMTEIQRALTKAGVRIKTVAAESGIVNGWQGDGWGHHFHVDQPISEALGSDFDFLALPGGARSADKLRQNPHARRIVNHFIEANKPIAAIGEGVGLLTLGEKIAGRTLAAPQEIADGLKAAGIIIGEDDQIIDENILTSNGEDPAAWVQEAIAFFAAADIIRRAA
jgi:protease I